MTSPPVVAPPPPQPSPRLESVDLLRGLVMVVMVLDHVRDFVGDMSLSALDLDETNIPLFLTRWVTHFCAPTFVFLAGTGAYLAGRRGKTSRQLSWFLLTRGIWLIVLELTAVRFGMTWSFAFHRGFLQVFWAIGCSMTALSAMIFLPTWVVGAFGAMICVGHNALDPLVPESFGGFAPAWKILHDGGSLEPFSGSRYYAGYPVLPWLGVMSCGYAFGSMLSLPAQIRRRSILALGLMLTAAFVALRWTNLYGDPNPWQVQPRGPAFTVLSFVNCDKYPPSLLYMLMTLGPAITFLGVFDRGIGRAGAPLITLGRVPLFFYLLQWPLAHAFALAMAILRGQPYAWLFGGGFGQAPEGFGVSLPWVYLMWILAVAILYVPSRWFAALKRRNASPWLSYL